MKPPIRIERHALGPRVHILGRRVHEYHLGVALLVASPRASWVAIPGAWLVVKDWPDLFPATRDTASWRLGIHRPPRPRAGRPGRAP